MGLNLNLDLTKASSRLLRWAGLAGLAGALGVCALLALPGADAQTPRTFRVPTDCRQNLSRTVDLDALAGNTSLLQAVARDCANAPEGRGLAYAQFYAGQANRILGEGPFVAEEGVRTVADQSRLNQALEQFGVAQGLARGDRELRRLAQVEAARVNRLLGRIDNRRYADALTLLNQIADVDRATLYERAMILIEQDDRSTANDDEQLDLALQDLQVFASRDADLRRPNRYVVHRGPLALAGLAKRLGEQVLDRPHSLENARQALTYFGYAEQAYNVLIAEGFTFGGADRERMYVDIGMLHLQRASLLATGQRSEMECGPGGDPRTLAAAERSFAEALRLQPNSIDGLWGMGCLQLSRGASAASAAAALRRAVTLVEDTTPDPNLRRPRAAYHTALARAQVETNDWAGAEASFEAAITHEPANARKAAIHFQAARLYRAHGRDAASVLRHLTAAIDIQSDAAARLLRAEIILIETEDPNDHRVTLRAGLPASDRRTAQADLIAALASAGNHQARTNYLLSLSEEQAPTDRTGRRAVDYATAAYRSERANRVYRRQACVTRIIFGHTEQGESPCTAEQGVGYTEDLFFEGLFWLRDAHRSRVNDRVNDWALAINAFDRGLDSMGGGASGAVDGQDLGAMLAYGKRFAFYCMGADAANRERPNDPESEGVRRIFGERYGLRRCWG